MHHLATLVTPLALAAALCAAHPAAAKPAAPPPVPATPKRPVVDEYQGVKVTDDYRWLENFSDPQVRAWSDAQNRRARAVLDALPGARAIRARLAELDHSTSADYGELVWRGGRLFALKSQPPRQQPFLVTLPSADQPAAERTVLDPNRLNPKGTTAIDWFVPSLDGRRVAVSLSEGGSENGTVHVYDVDGGRELGDSLPHVNGGTAGGSLCWNRDGTGFWYTRYPRPGERPAADLDFYQQVYFHRLGAPMDQDSYAIGRDFPRIAEVALQVSDDGQRVLASVENGDGGEYAHFLLGPEGRWTRIARFEDRVTQARFGPDGALYLLSLAGAPRGRLLRLAPQADSLAAAQVVVPEGEAVLSEFLPTATRLYVAGVVGGPSELEVYDLAGTRLSSVPVQPISAVDGLTRLEGDEILYRSASYLDPPAWYRCSPAAPRPVRTALFRTSPADFRDTEVVREEAVSKDGTKVPMYILRRKGTPLNHRNPTLLYGYGGYSLDETPRFSPLLRAWIEQGGVYARAVLRGGGEYGEDWHRAGNLTHKQNVFDDFAACARRLVAAGYTRPERLAVEGGSNGGLLMGALLTQHPELVHAVVSHVGIYDMLRVEGQPNGAFNVTEYGSVRDPEQFKALYAYSPYHHVVDGRRYPATLFLTGQNDPRVDPSHSRKMTARLQAASPATTVLLRTSSSSGHGIGSSRAERLAQQADVDAFLFHELGMKYQPVAPRQLRREPPGK